MTKKKAWQVFCEAESAIFVNFTSFSTDFNGKRVGKAKFEGMKQAILGGMMILMMSSCSRLDCSFTLCDVPCFSDLLPSLSCKISPFRNESLSTGDPQSQPKPITKNIIHDQEGVVEVIMKVSDDGQWKVVNLSATNEDLAKYVVSKLKEYQRQTPSKAIGQVVKYRFVFKQQT